jgi:protein-disulfide isomerase
MTASCSGAAREESDHVRSHAGHLIIDYGDHEWPLLAAGLPRDRASRTAAWRENAVRSGISCWTCIHPHALAVAAAADAVALQGRFWDGHELLFHRQKALEDSDLREYAARSA